MKNEYEIRGDVTAIILNSPKYGIHETLINTTDLQRAKEFPNTWVLFFDKKVNSFYVHGMTPRPNRKVTGFHRWILNSPKSLVVDHINHDTLNNTRGNLREITHSQNMQNRKGAQSNSKSGIRGVIRDKKNKKWYAKIKLNKKSIWLGYHENIEDAIKIVEEKRKELLPFSVNKEV